MWGLVIAVLSLLPLGHELRPILLAVSVLSVPRRQDGLASLGAIKDCAEARSGHRGQLWEAAVNTALTSMQEGLL